MLTVQSFEAIARFILAKGDRETYCNMYNNNPHFRFAGFDVFLDPEGGQQNIGCDPELSGFDELVVRVNRGTFHYRRVRLDRQKGELVYLASHQAELSAHFEAMLDAVNSEARSEPLRQQIAATWTTDPKAALRLALELWRGCGSMAAADLVDQLGRLASPSWRGLEGETEAERIESWIALEKQRALEDLELLLDTLCSFCCADALPLPEKIVRWVPDPRITSGLGKLLRDPPRRGYCGSESSPFWHALCEMLAANGDLRILGELKQLVADAEAAGSDESPRLQALPRCRLELELATVTPTSNAQQEAAIRELVIAVAERVNQGQAAADAELLLQRIYADPDNDELPLVLADLLQERGDPRGEFIALQRISRPSAQQKVRSQALEKKHGRFWLGRLAAVVEAVQFRGGFPYRCSVDVGKSTILTQLIGLPEWSTVRELQLINVEHPWSSPGSEKTTLDFLRHPVLRFVRLIHQVPLSFVEQLTEDRPLQQLHFWVATEESLRVVSACAHVPALRELSFGFGTQLDAERWRALLRSAVGQRLQKITIEVMVNPASLLELLPALPKELLQLEGRGGGGDDDLTVQIRRIDGGLRVSLASKQHIRDACVRALRPLRSEAVALIREVRVKRRGKRFLEQRASIQRTIEELIPDAEITFF